MISKPLYSRYSKSDLCGPPMPPIKSFLVYLMLCFVGGALQVLVRACLESKAPVSAVTWIKPSLPTSTVDSVGVDSVGVDTTKFAHMPVALWKRRKLASVRGL